MSDKKIKILAVDDEVFNLDLIQGWLEDAGFEVICAEDGEVALSKLKNNPDIEVIVLDRMMPKLDGMQTIKQIKEHPKHKSIPIIMQTAAGQSQQIQEGIEAGVFYYLTKPYSEALLVSIVKNAFRERMAYKDALKKTLLDVNLFGLIKQAHFSFRTLEDVSKVASYVANCCPNPNTTIYGLKELMINAVEHGNLNITYLEKLELMLEDSWQQEVERRLLLPENKNKYATLAYETDPHNIIITIKDQGQGFKWQSYLDFDPVRMASDPHGKGIAIAKVTSFPHMEFKNGGSEIVCRIPLNAPIRIPN
jgi:CheY-like chemotaxis protein